MITADDGGVLCVGARVDLHGTAAAWTLGVGCSSRNSSKVCYGGILPSYYGYVVARLSGQPDVVLPFASRTGWDSSLPLSWRVCA